MVDWYTMNPIRFNIRKTYKEKNFNKSKNKNEKQKQRQHNLLSFTVSDCHLGLYTRSVDRWFDDFYKTPYKLMQCFVYNL